MINIFTDSTSDLGNDLAERFNIHIIPQYVFSGGCTYRDGIDISVEELFRSVEETGQLPKTSAPTVGDFQEAFSMPGDNLFISLSGQLSATYSNAVLARDLMQSAHIYLIDSGNLSTGEGLLALEAADLRDEGVNTYEIYRQIEAMKPQGENVVYGGNAGLSV